MTVPMPKTEDPLRREAVDLATDVAGFLLEVRERLRPGVAYVLGMECVRIADRIQKGLPGEARTAAVRALIALDRAGAHAPLPREAVGSIQGRLHRLALALGAAHRRSSGG